MKKYIPLAVFVFSLTFLTILCAKEWTWIFTSSDSGDWLASAVTWMAPQPFGSPLYILLGRFVNLLPGNLALNMTLLLSVLPSAITVLLVYLIIKRLTDKISIALVCSLTLLGSAVFLSQSTVLEEYAITIMFLTGAYYAYIKNWRYRTVLLLGLGTAVHMFVALIAVFWILADRRWKLWLGKPLLAYIMTGIVPYCLILILMACDTPRLIAGGLNLKSIMDYTTTTAKGIVGNLSIFEAPARLLILGKLTLVCFGLALVPLVYYIRDTLTHKSLTKQTAVLLATAILCLWYFATNMDVLSWTWAAFASPSIIVLVGLGLAKLSRWHLSLVCCSALTLLAINSIFLNANTLTQENPKAMAYYNELNGLPDGTVIVTERGEYSMGLFYVINNGKNLIPLVYPYLDESNFEDYRGWLNEKYQLGIDTDWDTLTLIAYLKSEGKDVYYAYEGNSRFRRCLILEEGFTEDPIKRINSLSGLPPEPFIEEVK